MTEQQIVPVDQLVPSADVVLDDAVHHWHDMAPEPLLDIGDALNEVHRRSQLAIGAWLALYADALGYGAIADLAERWGRSPRALYECKSVYKRGQSLLHDVDSLEFGKAQQLARIPAEHQADWVTPATEMKRLRKI